MGIFDLKLLTVKSGEYSDISDFDDSDETLVKASQDAETNTAESGEQKTPRCLAFLSDVELKNLKESAIPVNTRNKS
uniref:Uncharacterized protein n=1 Tax=Magallana gigas TaxID=29159 RepID=K1R4X3_MAGGI